MDHQVKNAISDAPAVRRKIPMSLSVVSYIFFGVGLLMIIMGFAGAAAARADLPLSLIFGVLYLFISRGLRRCSRLWHICALIAISCSLILVAYGAVNYFLSPAYRGMDKFAYRFLLVLAFGFLVRVWMLQVLTRGDVRRLFYGNSSNAA
jgi:hypothetical protein